MELFMYAARFVVGILVPMLAGCALPAERQPPPVAPVPMRPPVVFEAVGDAGSPAFRLQSRPETQFDAEGATFLLDPSRAAVRLTLAGGRPVPPVPLDRLPFTSSHFRGRDASAWRRGVSGFARLRYAAVYPGTDMVFHGRDGSLEVDFELEPLADPGRIAIRLDGVDAVAPSAAGDLVLHSGGSRLTLRRPVAWQDGPEGREDVPVAFRLSDNDGSVIRFDLGGYDRARALVIDPRVIYGTAIGGSGADVAYALHVDDAGRAYVVGDTRSADFPAAGGLQPEYGDRRSTDSLQGDAFVARLDPSATRIEWITFFGGSRLEETRGLAVGPLGQVCFGGWTMSSDLPTHRAVQAQLADGEIPADASGWDGGDTFVACLNEKGDELLFATYLGGREPDSLVGMAFDAGGELIVAGTTFSRDDPATPENEGLPRAGPAFQPASNGRPDAFVAAFRLDGGLRWVTHVGGREADFLNAMAIDASGRIWITGKTLSPDFPRRTQPISGNGDLLLAALSPDGTSVVQSLELGGNAEDAGTGIGFDAKGQVYVSGITRSSDFPGDRVRPGPPGVDWDVFLWIGTPDLQTLRVMAVGGSGHDKARAIAVAPDGGAYLLVDASNDFPLRPGCDFGALLVRIPPGWGYCFAPRARGRVMGEAIVARNGELTIAGGFIDHFGRPPDFLALLPEQYRGDFDAFVARSTERPRPLESRPDLAIRREGAPTFIGDNEYVTDPAWAPSASGAVARGETLVFDLQVQNDGRGAARPVLRASVTGVPLSVRYEASGEDITAAVTSGGWNVGPLGSGARRSVTISVRLPLATLVPRPSDIPPDLRDFDELIGPVRALLESTVWLTVSSQPGDSRPRDIVQAVVTRRPSIKP
jgi:hypothetical protein